MASQTLAEISRSELKDLSTLNATVTELQQLASYNWLDEPAPTILVPGKRLPYRGSLTLSANLKGSPPLWSPPSVPPKLAPDSGTVYIDQNAARNPRSPLEPLFRALYARNPDFELRDIDLVTDRNNILKLLHFVQGSSNDAFQIQVEIVGSKTALFTRTEVKTTDTIQNFRGFGHNFKKSYTKRQIGSTGHHRIINYHFGDMRCIVRHEADGYIDDKARPIAVTNAPELTDGLSDILSRLSISKLDTMVSNLPASIIVKTDGKAVDLSSTLEIKTRAASRMLDMDEVASQLWISQTPNLVVGYHRNGVFRDLRLRDMKQDIRDWELANQRALCNLASLMKKITTVVKQSGSSNAVVKYDGGTKIRIISGEQKRALPDDLYLKWEGKGQDRSEDTQPLDMESTSTDLAEKKNKDDGKKVIYSQRRSDQDTSPLPVRDDIPFSDMINYGLRHGLRQFFRRMPTQLSDYHVLCNSLKSLAVNVLAGRTMRDIMEDMRRGKSDWDPDEGRDIKGLKSLARDSAFMLLYGFLLGEFGSEGRDQNMAYNATVFVVSHPGIFKYRTRRMVREAFDEKFQMSEKQRKVLNNWSTKYSSSRESQEEDVTTEVDDSSDSDFDFDSDYS
jgi:hypothetical protein